MDFKTFVNVSKALPKDITVMIRGPHGIGKSQCVYQLADHFGLPMMERRLSQMTDGDMIGVLDDDDSYVVGGRTVSYTHLRAHETRHDLVCRLLLEKKK